MQQRLSRVLGRLRIHVTITLRLQIGQRRYLGSDKTGSLDRIFLGDVVGVDGVLAEPYRDARVSDVLFHPRLERIGFGVAFGGIVAQCRFPTIADHHGNLVITVVHAMDLVIGDLVFDVAEDVRLGASRYAFTQ